MNHVVWLRMRVQVAKTWCTVNKVLRTIVCIYVAACISQITRFFDSTFQYVRLP